MVGGDFEISFFLRCCSGPNSLTVNDEYVPMECIMLPPSAHLSWAFLLLNSTNDFLGVHRRIYSNSEYKGAA